MQPFYFKSYDKLQLLAASQMHFIDWSSEKLFYGKGSSGV